MVDNKCFWFSALILFLEVIALAIAPANLTITDFQSDRVMYIKAEWDKSLSAFVDHYVLGYKLTTETDWEEIPFFLNNGTFSVETLGTYDIRVKAVDTTGSESGWTYEQHTVSLINLSITRQGDSVDTDQALIVQDIRITGRVSTTTGSNVVTGTSTEFYKELMGFEYIKIEDNVYQISSIESDTSLTLTTNALADEVDRICYIANSILFNGIIRMKKGREGIIWTDTGWQIIDDSLLDFDILTFKNPEDGTFVNFASLPEQLQFQLTKGSKYFRVVLTDDENINIETDEPLLINSKDPDLFDVFIHRNSYYRYEKLSFKQMKFRVNPRDKTVTQEHTQTGITAVSQSFPLWDLQDVQETENDIRYELKEANCIDVTSSTVIAFTDLSGLTITDHYGSCTIPTVSGNNVVFSDTGSLTAFRFSNGQWIVTEISAGSLAWNVGDAEGNDDLGEGTISNFAYGTDNIYSYNWNYGFGNLNRPAKLDGSECVDGTAITNPVVYGFNGAQVVLNEYETNLDVQGDQTRSRTLTAGTRYSAQIDPNGTGGFLDQYPRGINYWNSTTNAIQLPSHERRTKYQVEFVGTFTAASANGYLLLELQINGGSNFILRSTVVPIIRNGVAVKFTVNTVFYVGEELAQYGAKVYITPINSGGTLEDEGIQISKLK